MHGQTAQKPSGMGTMMQGVGAGMGMEQSLGQAKMNQDYLNLIRQQQFGPQQQQQQYWPQWNPNR